MDTAYFRQEARASLKNKMGIFALIYLIAVVLLSAVSVSCIGTIVIAGPIELGLVICSLKAVRGKSVDIINLFDGFGNFTKSLLLYLLNAILVFLWSLLLIIPGIIKAYSYSMSFYILRDNPNIGVNDARKLSMQVMDGKKKDLFLLHLSFIGWFLLTILTLGILYFWVAPYVRTAEALFYESIKDEIDFDRITSVEDGDEDSKKREKSSKDDEDAEVEIIEEDYDEDKKEAKNKKTKKDEEE